MMMVELFGMNLQDNLLPFAFLFTANELVMGHCRFCLFRIFDIWKPFPISGLTKKLLVALVLCLMTSLQVFGLHLYFYDSFLFFDLNH
jgi:hypothetical protein